MSSDHNLSQSWGQLPSYFVARTSDWLMARAAAHPAPRVVVTRCPGTVLFLMTASSQWGFDKRSDRAKAVMV
jgi:hypothetical protein